MRRAARRVTVAALTLVSVAAAATPAFAQSGPQTGVARMLTSDGVAAGRVDVISLEALLDVAEGAESGGGAGSSEAALTGRLARRQEEDFTLVAATLRGLPPGFHGFHVHETGSCQGPSFASAGGHFNPTGANHPHHAGDMPVLHVNADGTATAAFFSDRFGVRQLFDVDGSAIVVHANPDNYANIPTDRYDPDPDATTLATGDAGDRIACGVLRRLVRCTVTVTPRRLQVGKRAVVTARVRSGGRPVREGAVFVRGPGFAGASPTNARGLARFSLRPARPGRVRVRVESDLETLGCSTTVRVYAARAAKRPALAGRAA